MKKFILLIAFVTGIAFSSFAQTIQAPVTAEQKANEVVEKLKTNLSLTDDQIPKVQGITIDRINKVTEARKKYGADKQRIQSANKLIFDQWESQLKGIVTLEQYNQYIQSKNQY